MRIDDLASLFGLARPVVNIHVMEIHPRHSLWTIGPPSRFFELDTHYGEAGALRTECVYTRQGNTVRPRFSGTPSDSH